MINYRKDKRFKAFEVMKKKSLTMGKMHLASYIFNIKTPIDDLWDLYFVLRILLDYTVYYNWTCFYIRYMKGDDLK